MHNLEIINNLEVLIDWLGFTFFEFANPLDVVSYLGFNECDFAVSTGSNGYKSSLRHNMYSITVLYDGAENMGIHVNISGSAIGHAIETYIQSIKEPTPFGDYAIEYSDEDMATRYLRHINECAKFTRMDLAIDDKGCNYYSVDDVLQICREKRCATRFRKCRVENEFSFTGDDTGNTLYIGKRQSDVFLRIYDKRLEQIAKNGTDCSCEWVRWELELKKERAVKAVEYLLSGYCLGSVTIGILSNYFRVIVRDDSNVSRCTTDPLWECFVGGVEKLRLSISKTTKTISEKKDWIIKQCMPTISAVVASEFGDMSFITDRLEDSLYRNSKTVLDMVFSNNPALKESVLV